MQKLNVNHDSTSTSEAFAGEDKIHRLRDKLEELMNHDGPNSDKAMSHTIQTAVELYADTIEEAIGIAIIISDSMNAFRERYNGNSLPSISSMFSNAQHTSKMSAIESIEQRFGSVKNYMKVQSCENCVDNGNCTTQLMADGVDISWREGRKLE